MNAFDTTAQDLANALSGMKRVEQTVFVYSARNYSSPLGPIYSVLVTPKGAKLGTCYEVSRRTLALLQAGACPIDLELEPVEDDEAEDEAHCPFDREASRADSLNDMRREAV